MSVCIVQVVNCSLPVLLVDGVPGQKLVQLYCLLLDLLQQYVQCVKLNGRSQLVPLRSVQMRVALGRRPPDVPHLYSVTDNVKLCS